MTLAELKRRLKQADDGRAAWRANISDTDLRQESHYYDDELADAAREALPDLIAAVECLRKMREDAEYAPDMDVQTMELADAILKRLGVE